jgi:hypothetical protein
VLFVLERGGNTCLNWKWTKGMREKLRENESERRRERERERQTER